jgi:hypothetical protein
MPCSKIKVNNTQGAQMSTIGLIVENIPTINGVPPVIIFNPQSISFRTKNE